MDAGTRNVADRVRAGVAVGIGDRLTQGTGAAVVRVGDRIGESGGDSSRARLREADGSPNYWKYPFTSMMKCTVPLP